MGRIGGGRAGRWPRGAWFALVGVSAGTVAMFAAVAWAFTDAAGLYEGPEAAGPPRWTVEEPVVIEAESAPSPTPDSPAEPAPGAGAGEPTIEAVGEEQTEAVPESEHATPPEESEAPLEPVEPESSGAPDEDRVAEEWRLTLLEEPGECDPVGEPLPIGPTETPEDSNESADPELNLDHTIVDSASPKE